ncbi:hypothetical protein AB4Z50_25900 [Paenibacillus sp. 2TAB26]|uniref:hypothetical protein n=1 Tax=Paenibacillus sp. 2TAB26 TaxID=3233005 RepID=UPI003F966DD2
MIRIVDTNPEVLAKFLKVDVALIKVWSDRSMTVGHDTTHDYKVSRRKIQYDVAFALFIRSQILMHIKFAFLTGSVALLSLMMLTFFFIDRYVIGVIV